MGSFYGGVSLSGSSSGGGDGVGVSNASINENGELVFTYTDGKIQNLGKIVGEDGVAFTPHIENGVLSWTKDDGSSDVPGPINLLEADTWTELPSTSMEELAWKEF